MRPKHATLTPQELEIMKVVWECDSATVRDVYEALLKQRKIAYTTVMTMMKILETKGYLKKRRQDRAFVYQPVRPKSQVIGGMIREFIDRVFNGAAEPLLVHLVKSRHISEKDLQKIIRLVEETKCSGKKQEQTDAGKRVCRFGFQISSLSARRSRYSA
jgi:BlaI family penicillinase repressor